MFVFLSLFVFIAIPLKIWCQYNTENVKLVENEAASKQIERLFTYKKLRLYPIRATQNFVKAHQDIGNYLTLKKGLTEKTVIIREKQAAPLVDSNPPPARVLSNINRYNQYEQIQQYATPARGETVSELFIDNLSKDTLLLLAGEVIKGGKQDRVIAMDMLIPPNTKEIKLNVFCVEKNRWQYHKAGEANFNEYFQLSSMSVRKAAAKSKNQKQVWEQVKKVSDKYTKNNTTGTYTAIANSEKLKKQVADYKNHFTKAFENESMCIGVVVTTGDTILGCDMFATPKLFKEYFNNLLESYITEAVTHGKPVSIADAKVQQYLNHILDENKQDEIINNNGIQLKSKQNKIHINTY